MYIETTKEIEMSEKCKYCESEYEGEYCLCDVGTIAHLRKCVEILRNACNEALSFTEGLDSWVGKESTTTSVLKSALRNT